MYKTELYALSKHFNKKNDGVLVITINRPRNLNAQNHSTILELNHAFGCRKNRNIKCLILTGTGKQSFIAGADIKEFSTFNQKRIRTFKKWTQYTF